MAIRFIACIFLIFFCVTGSFGQTKYLPKQYINTAQTYAQNNYSPNATMYAITAAIGLDTNGKATDWFYWFYQPNVTDTGYVVAITVIVIPIPLGTRTVNLPGTFLRPLDTTFCESNLAVNTAENSGGRQFRQAHANNKMYSTIFKTAAAPDTSKPYWTVLYSDSAAGAYQNFFIDGNTCSLIPVAITPVSSEIPQKFSLYQNYPNPFNPATKIKFDLAESGFVNIIVYDAIGKEVSRPVSEEMNAGRYETVFDGSAYASGIYYYSLETNGFKETKKMLMIK
jgi:hypothetical protein